MHKLTIEDDEGKSVVVPLIRDQITIGRQDGNTIRLTEQNISRRHARLFQQDGLLYVEDLGSFNGVKVNGIRLAAPSPVNDGDLIVVGDYKLGVKLDKKVVGRAPTPAAGATMPARQVAAVAEPQLAPTPDAPPPVAEMMESAPTIPVRTLADQGLIAGSASAAPVLPPARLAVITTNLAGAEHRLDRASQVIGRTPENDIVLNHKSISRHHAKIIRDGERYVVVDLESANGVRVNGAEYERTELQSGDVLELGHVRLRFLGAGETRAFAGSPLLSGPSKKTLVVAALGGIAALGAAVLIFGGGKPPTKPAATSVAAPVASAPAAPTPTPVPAAGTAPTRSPDELAAPMLAEAKTAIHAENWPGALAALTKAAAVAPDAPAVANLRKTVESERENADRFAALKRAATANQHDLVLASYAAIPEGSAYRARSVALFEASRSKLVARHLEGATKLRSQGKCDDARKEADAVLALDEQNEPARQIIRLCAQATVAKIPAAPKAAPAPKVAMAAQKPAPAPKVAAKPAPSPRAPRTVAAAGATSPRPLSAADEPTGGADPDALMTEAQDAWLKSQYAAAIEASRKALRAKPGLSRAYQIIAVCSCSLRDADAATRAYDKLLDDKLKQLVRTLCHKSGIDIQ